MAIDANDPRPPYRQVADDLRHRIQTTKEFEPGARLPSIRSLAAAYGIAPQTVQNALRELREAGLVVSQQGRAFFVRDPDRPIGVSDDLAGRVSLLEEQLQELRRRVEGLEAER
ncbi:GntR family transcriptional regulator [Actinomadura kijaniata]|uniref:GntR family transcriptional regulator n=1 Tax=Actinomadura kijaniata TaxID=46161 RepID=UPI000831C079|nr:GntR family transcriptional regulator [Actinomadura kijaniata]